MLALFFALGRFLNVFGVLFLIFFDFLSISNGFWEDLVKSLVVFRKDLRGKTLIGATKGKSMDGWMDGWMDGEDLIICLAIWTLYKP